MASLTMEPLPVPAKETNPSSLKDWAIKYELNLPAKHYRDNCTRIETMMQFLGPARRPCDVFRADVEALMDYLKNKKGLADLTCTRYRRIGLAWFNFIRAFDGTDANPFQVPRLSKWNGKQLN